MRRTPAALAAAANVVAALRSCVLELGADADRVHEVVGDVDVGERRGKAVGVGDVGDGDLDVVRPRSVAQPGLRCAPSPAPSSRRRSSSGTSRPPMYPLAPVTSTRPAFVLMHHHAVRVRHADAPGPVRL